MNIYEHTCILSQNLNPKDLKDIRAKIETIIEKNQGKIEKVEDWGLRNLAYPIKKFKKGYYSNIFFSASGTAVFELEKFERIDENVLRFLTFKVKEVPKENSELCLKEENK
ncbi:MAG: 30S ribosomal protein S6 [Candidatus Fonsibacter sp.]|jgi:small subunit ribosomal protein S6